MAMVRPAPALPAREPRLYAESRSAGPSPDGVAAAAATWSVSIQALQAAYPAGAAEQTRWTCPCCAGAASATPAVVRARVKAAANTVALRTVNLREVGTPVGGSLCVERQYS